MRKWKVAAINFDHFHMGDNLRMAFEHPGVEIVGLWDERPERMTEAVKQFSISPNQVFSDYRQCLEESRPDFVLLCPATAEHGEWTEKVAPFGVHILMEKPFAASLDEADRMTRAVEQSSKQLLINWPLAWYPSHRTSKRLIDEGQIGDVIEVHYYGGNRGPLWHAADKIERSAEDVAREKPESWFYKRAHGGGSLLDYLGYGTTLGTWFLDGRVPREVSCTVDEPIGLDVDEHSVTVARYERGLCVFQTRWGTLTDPWTHQPQPRCGFVIVGSKGTISSYDYDDTVRLQTRDNPAGRDIPTDLLQPPYQNPVQYLVDCLSRDVSVEGPVSAAISRIGQQIVDSAVVSANEKKTVTLTG